jgi:hypothetical protein
MITLRDTAEIDAPPEQIFEFFLHFRENYLAWHPDHVDCRYLTDGPLGEGSIVYVEEYLHGKLHKLELHVTQIVPYSHIEYTFAGGDGAFRISPCEAGGRFTAELGLGIETPVLGKLLDRCLRAFLGRQLQALEQHMVEEGQNLKRIMAAG